MDRNCRPLAWIVGALACSSVLAQPAKSTCQGVSPVENSTLKSVVVASAVGRPLLVTAPPGDFDRIFIVEQDGRIFVMRRGGTSAPPPTFLDISTRISTVGNEMGLLGMAFDPAYSKNGFFYVSYTERVGSQTRSVIARHTVSPLSADIAGAAETRVLEFDQPQTNHNGGHIAFGPDGFLYMSSGDGGGSNDGHGTCGNGQDRSSLLGAMLRIDVTGDSPNAADCGEGSSLYSIPDDNPFRDGAQVGDCDEIWATGLRNPWRFSFDAVKGDLYIGDVGQNCHEEINWVPGTSTGAENYGWRPMEGQSCFDPNSAFNCNPMGVSCIGSPACQSDTLTDPILDVGRSGGVCAITGGEVYRGCRMPNFRGTYFYGDYCAGFVRSFEVDGNGNRINDATWTNQVAPGGSLSGGLTSFGTDGQGEIYVLDRDGLVLKLMPPFPDFAVSAPGAVQFRMESDGDWTWEDLELSSMHPVDSYRVYRGTPDGPFVCLFETPNPIWAAGGDLTVPASRELLAYIVTAISDGEETSSGTPPRDVTLPCS